MPNLSDKITALEYFSLSQAAALEEQSPGFAKALRYQATAFQKLLTDNGDLGAAACLVELVDSIIVGTGSGAND